MQDTNVSFLICNGLNDTRDSLINGKLYKSIGIININEIKDWTKLKGESKENQSAPETMNLSDLLNFQLSLLDDEGKPIKFAPNQKKAKQKKKHH